MSSRSRLILGGLLLVVVIGGVIGLDQIQRRAATSNPQSAAITLVAGSVPVYKDGILVAGFSPADLQRLEKVSFNEPVEGISQDGWMLRDVLLLHIPKAQLTPDLVITVSSSSRDKSVQLTWAEVDRPENMVMFDLSNRGTLKLVSVLEKLDTRDEWVQDVDKIDVAAP